MQDRLDRWAYIFRRPVEATPCLLVVGAKRNSSSLLHVAVDVITKRTVTKMNVSSALQHKKARLPTILKMMDIAMQSYPFFLTTVSLLMSVN